MLYVAQHDRYPDLVKSRERCVCVCVCACVGMCVYVCVGVRVRVHVQVGECNGDLLLSSEALVWSSLVRPLGSPCPCAWRGIEIACQANLLIVNLEVMLYIQL